MRRYEIVEKRNYKIEKGDFVRSDESGLGVPVVVDFEGYGKVNCRVDDVHFIGR